MPCSSSESLWYMVVAVVVAVVGTEGIGGAEGSAWGGAGAGAGTGAGAGAGGFAERAERFERLVEFDGAELEGVEELEALVLALVFALALALVLPLAWAWALLAPLAPVVVFVVPTALGPPMSTATTDSGVGRVAPRLRGGGGGERRSEDARVPRGDGDGTMAGGTPTRPAPRRPCCDSYWWCECCWYECCCCCCCWWRGGTMIRAWLSSSSSSSITTSLSSTSFTPSLNSSEGRDVGRI